LEHDELLLRKGYPDTYSHTYHHTFSYPNAKWNKHAYANSKSKTFIRHDISLIPLSNPNLWQLIRD
jgi:hypothetical protein